VTTSLVTLMKRHPATGWIRANAVASESAKEILRLRDEVDALKTELSKHIVPAGIEDLAQGEEGLNIQYLLYGPGVTAKVPMHMMLSWNSIFNVLSVQLLFGASVTHIESSVGMLVHQNTGIPPDQQIKVSDGTISQIMLQLRALDLIVQTTFPGVWKLTPRGETRLVKSKALKSTARPTT